MKRFNRVLIHLNIVLAIINLTNGIVLKRMDSVLVAAFNLATAYFIHAHQETK